MNHADKDEANEDHNAELDDGRDRMGSTTRHGERTGSAPQRDRGHAAIWQATVAIVKRRRERILTIGVCALVFLRVLLGIIFILRERS